MDEKTIPRVNNGKEVIQLTPLVAELSGVVKLPPEFNYKKDYVNHLLKKHQ